VKLEFAWSPYAVHGAAHTPNQVDLHYNDH
jgi:hypothetical protein